MVSRRKTKAKTTTQSRPRRRKAKELDRVDFDDEDEVLRAMAKALDEDPDDLTIEVDTGLTSFGVGDIYRVEMGQREWYVARNEEVAERLALARVRQDLEDEPSIFNEDFIRAHINIEKLKRELWGDVYNSAFDRLHHEAEQDPLGFMSEHEIDVPPPEASELRKFARANRLSRKAVKRLAEMSAEDQWAELGDEPEVPQPEVETIAERQTENELSDPLQYMEDIWGDEAFKKALEIAGVDVEEAAKDLVRSDGYEHFIASYDGTVKIGPSELAFWRHN